MVTPAGDVYTYHFNAVGSTIAMTDSGQTVVNKYSYDPFGNVAANSVENVPQPFKFVGQYGVMTEPNGFYYMRARYYDPEVGRFISEDPIGFEGGDVNLYVYASNNPILLIDPSGLIEVPGYEQLLKNTRDYFGVATWGTALSGLEPAALVFGAVALGSEALRVGFYSKTPVIDTATMVAKVATKMNDPSLNKFKDKALELSVDYLKSSNNKYNISPYGTPSYNPVLRCHAR
jgi:RHS repeat-associated protein